jgi:hypothetical protein
MDKLTLKTFFESVVEEAFDKVLFGGGLTVGNMKTEIRLYHLKGYNLEQMEVESILHMEDIDGQPFIELTVKGVGTDEGGNLPE